MPLIQDLLHSLEQQIPLDLAEPWDNVGLLLGHAQAELRSVMTCLTLTEDVADEAIREGANLIISHHPILFKAVQRLTTATSEGRMLLRLIEAEVSVYSPHTAFDSAAEGINQQIALTLGLQEIQPIRGKPGTSSGSGRWGRLPTPAPLGEILHRWEVIRGGQPFTYVGDLNQLCDTIGIACGAAGEYLSDAAALGCQVFLTGETRFHTCLEARTRGVALVMVGHYTSERFAIEELARRLAAQWAPIPVWASRHESDPVRFHP